MRELNGYRLLVIARKITRETVWHYSTGNDDPVCGRKGTAEMVGYIDTEIAEAIKGCCNLCARYVGIHGDYQGWDSVNEVRYLSISNPRPSAVLDAYKSGAFCAMHGKFISQCTAQHNNDSDSGFRETESIPVKKSAFPIATMDDTNDHFMGSGFDCWGWWDRMHYAKASHNGDITSWQFMGQAGYPDDFDASVTIDHAAVIRAIRKIANIPVNEDYSNTLYASRSVIRECKTWIFKGPDACDFDAGMADEVMQVAAFGVVTYC